MRDPRDDAGRILRELGTAVEDIFNNPIKGFGEIESARAEGIDTFFFANSGAEITEAAVKLAKQITTRPNTIVFEGGFHGNHDYAAFSQFPTGPANYPLAAADSGGVPGALQDTMLVAPYNDLTVVEVDVLHRDRIAVARGQQPVGRRR